MFRNNRLGIIPVRYAVLIALLYCCAGHAGAQVLPGGTPTLSNAVRDTSNNKTNTSTWTSGDIKIDYRVASSARRRYPGTSIHTFHRRPFLQPWHRDLGNLGSPVRNVWFSPQEYTGPVLGYHLFDIYRFRPDSLRYYNTTRPYSEFTFQLGSKAEQMAQILHTQNIKPNWNVAMQYRKLTSPGYYKIQRNNFDNASLSTNYRSKNLRYTLLGGVVYNKQQHDANGGIAADSLLDDERFRDRKTVAVNFDNDAYSTVRSSVTNIQRDVTALLQHAYTWGRTDTTYSEDSTQYSFRLVPRFSISHRLEVSSEKFQYKDKRPETARYAPFFPATFAPGDSLQMEQHWERVENLIALNGFLGPEGRQLKFTAGLGSRYDRFRTAFVTGEDKSNTFSNYLTGTLAKEALKPGEWFYQADARIYLTGQAVGDFALQGSVGKDLGRDWGELSAGLRQQLSQAPYNYSLYQNPFIRIATDMGKQNITQLYLRWYSGRLDMSGGVSNYVIGNYIYLDSTQRPAQFAPVFNLTQAWIRKAFHLGIWVLDNELAVQQPTGNAPVNVPLLMGRHQISVETYLFRRSLKAAVGAEVRYHTAYAADGYSPLMGRFYYQERYMIGNRPEASVFFNFKIKRFRAYIMGDQMQQMLFRNAIASPGYPLQDAMLRFGFNWVMIN